MPGDKKPVSKDEVPPRDKADAIARDYEEGHHERAGVKKDKDTPSYQHKAKSVRVVSGVTVDMASNGKQPDAALELMSELKALVSSGGVLGALDERRVRAVVDDMCAAHAQLESIRHNPYADPAHPFYASSLTYFRARCLRDKRCLLTYLLWRQGRATDMWWTAQDNRLQDVLTECERAYLREYDDTMVEYMTSFAIPLDLRAFMWRPPCVQQLEVRGLRDHVFVSNTTGNTVTIYAGKLVSLSFEEAELLILQGVVELVTL